MSFFSLGGIQVSPICNGRCEGFNFQAPEAQPLPSPAPEGCSPPSLDHCKLHQDPYQQEQWWCCPIQNIVWGGWWLVGSTRRALYCDYCNAYNRKSRSWNLVAIGMQILGLAGVFKLELQHQIIWLLAGAYGMFNVLEISSTWARFADVWSMKLLEALVLKMVRCSTTRKLLFWLLEQCNILELPAPPSLGCSGCLTCGVTRDWARWMPSSNVLKMMWQFLLSLVLNVSTQFVK